MAKWIESNGNLQLVTAVFTVSRICRSIQWRMDVSSINRVVIRYIFEPDGGPGIGTLRWPNDATGH